ncbi:MAG: acetolactate decarboxylase [Planctomycetes bacterium]|nr:acetolactate decarboxylase [Planctomycetota bacterium]
MRPLLRRLLLAVAAASLLTGCAAPADRETLYQVSTLPALLEGGYDGLVTVGELKSRGDFGLGTFDALDGEMIVLDGTVYQATADGRVRTADDSTTVPFAAVTFFDPDETFVFESVSHIDNLETLLNACLPSPNLMYAIRITGRFDYVKVRSVPRQSKPYPRLADVAARQPVFEHQDVSGTLVVLRLPDYMKGLNVAGYHFHFISDDRSIGGHVLDCRFTQAAVAIDDTVTLHVDLPRGGDFLKADLATDRTGEVERIEK